MSEIDKYFKAVPEKDMDKWIPKPKGFYGKLFLRITNSDEDTFEIDVDKIKEDRPQTSVNSIISAFYSWKRKKPIKQLLEDKNLDVKIVKRGDKVGIVKSVKFPTPPPGKKSTTTITVNE